MNVGNYNFHQMLFALDTFKGIGEKIGYLEKIQNELKRIIVCFESEKSLPLEMYASPNYYAEECCSELANFIKHQSGTLSSNPYDKNLPGEGKLRGLVKAELVNYKKLLTIVEDEINSIQKKNTSSQENTKRKENTKKEIKFILIERYSPQIISKLLNESKGQKIIWNSSIGELIDLVKIIIILELVDKLEEKHLPKFIANNFVDSSKKIYAIPQIDKVHKMLQNTFWLNEKRAKSESSKYFNN